MPLMSLALTEWLITLIPLPYRMLQTLTPEQRTQLLPIQVGRPSYLHLPSQVLKAGLRLCVTRPRPTLEQQVPLPERPILKAGLKMSPPTLNGIRPRLKQHREPRLVRMGSTRSVGDVVHDLRVTTVEVGVGAVAIGATAEVKAGIVAVAVGTAVSAAEEMGVIVDEGEADEGTVAVVMPHHSKKATHGFSKLASLDAGALILGSDA